MVYEIFQDACIAGLFLIIGQILRSKITFFQKFFIPASLIAGILAFICGQQVLGILQFSDDVGDYAGILIVIVFASLGWYGINFSKGSGERIGSLLMYSCAMFLIQVGPPILLSIFLLSKLHPGLSDGFGLLLVSGFYGGHGTAAAIGSTFARLGFEEATDIAMTFATIGILTAVFGGIYHIKRGIKKGWTCYVNDYESLDGYMRTGLVDKKNRTSIGDMTVHTISMDPLAWHLALLLVPSMLGIWIADWIDSLIGIYFPDFMFAFLFALLFWYLFKPMKLESYVDTRIMERIAGVATDFIVFFGVANIKIPVIVKYAVPLALMTLFGWIAVHLTVTYFGPRMNKESWFERSMFTYGYSTGVYAMGFMLLRIVDPDNKSLTLQDTAVIETPFTFLDFLVWGICPTMLMSGQGVLIGVIFTVAFVAFLVLARVFKWWYKEPLSERKPVDFDAAVGKHE